ncbi:MAG: phage tail tape measure protein [Dehalococcoidia bacterium]|nr:phage tail tape measure protein [Dehalococcoidia bacterium]
MVSGFGGGVLTGVIGQAVIEVVLDNSGLDKSLTTTQKALGGAFVAGAGAASVAALSYESAMAAVAKTTNANQDQLRDLNQLFRAQSREIPMSAAALAGLGATAAQLGVEVGNLGAFTETVAKLGTATNIVGEQGAQDLARFLNVAGETTDAAGNVASALVDLGNNSATTEAEILDMSLRVAAAGRQLGITTGETLGLSAAMSSLGIRSEAGGTALSRVLLDIYAKSQQGAVGLEDYAYVAGVTSEKFLQMVESNPIDALSAFIGGMATAEQRGFNLIAMLDEMSLGDVRVRDTLLRLAGAQDLVTASVRRGNEAYADNTALQHEFDIFAETGANQLKILANQFINLGIAAGNLTIPILKQVASVLGVLVDGFSAAPPQVQLMALALFGLVAVGGPLNAMLSLTWKNLGRLQAFALAGPAAWGKFAMSLGPAGAAGALLAVGMAADGILQKTTGHGLIDWLFRDPRTADAATGALAAFNDELARTDMVLNSDAGIRAAREELAGYVQDYQRAKEARDALAAQTGVAIADTRSMKEARATIVEMIKAAVDAGVSFEDLHRIVIGLDGELGDAARGAIPDYDERVRGLAASFADSEQAALSASRGFATVGESTGSASVGIIELGQNLLELNPRIMATAVALRLMNDLAAKNPMALFNFARGLMQVRELVSFQAGVEKLADFIVGDLGTRGGGGGGGGGGSAPTAIERATDAFADFGDRAPKALRAARAELLMYRTAAAQAGDTTARDLIDQLLTMDPTVSQMRNAIRGLQSQYGDLAAEASESARVLREASQIAADAWETLHGRAVSEADRAGGLIIRALREQADQALAVELKSIEERRAQRQADYDQQVADLRRHTDALLAPLQAELDALDAAGTADELKALDDAIALAWDPRERAKLEQQRVELLRRIRADELRDEMAGIEENHTRQAEALRRHLDDQLAALDAKERTARNIYARTTEQFALEEQARKMLLEGNLEEMTDLIRTYLGESWVQEFQSFGERVINGPLANLKRELQGILGLMGGVGAPGVSPGGRSAAMQAAIDRIASAKASGSALDAMRLPGLREQFQAQFGIASPLAGGGVITQPTFAYLGETPRARPEIVSPEHLMRRIVREESGGRGGVIELHNYTVLDGAVIDHRVERVVADATRQAAGRGRYGA